MTKSLKDRSPAMQFYFRQFAGDEHVMAMDLDAVGAHILLMCAAGASDFGYRLANDWHAIGNRLRNPKAEDLARIKGQLMSGAWKVSECGQYIEQEGMKRTLLKQKEFSEKQRRNALARVQPNVSQTTSQKGAKDRSSSSSSSSSSSTNKEISTYGTPTSNSEEVFRFSPGLLPPVNQADEYAVKAREALEEPEPSCSWVQTNAFICEGRRPLKRYPEILLKEPDLARILREIEEAGVPRAQVHKVFQAAADRLASSKRQGKRTESVAVEAWLTGFCLKEVLEVLKAGTQFQQSLKRGETNARG